MFNFNAKSVTGFWPEIQKKNQFMRERKSKRIHTPPSAKLFWPSKKKAPPCAMRQEGALVLQLPRLRAEDFCQASTIQKISAAFENE
jgi:hypothetical protein